jgi:hypothetical protein
LQWCALQQRFRLSADPSHQALRFGIGTDDQVLAVVEAMPVHLDTARAPPQLAGGLEYSDRGFCSDQLGGTGEPSPASADNGNAPKTIHAA